MIDQIIYTSKDYFNTFSRWLFDFSYRDPKVPGKPVQWKIANNLMKAITIIASIDTGIGVYGLVNGEAFGEQVNLITGLSIIAIGLGANGFVGGVALKRYFQCQRIENARNEAAQKFDQVILHVHPLNANPSGNYENSKEIIVHQFKQIKSPNIPFTTTYSNSNNFCSLPQEILFSIFDYLSKDEIIKTSLTCRYWYHLTLNCHFWDKFMKIKNIDSKEYRGKNGYVAFFAMQTAMKLKITYDEQNKKLDEAYKETIIINF